MDTAQSGLRGAHLMDVSPKRVDYRPKARHISQGDVDMNVKAERLWRRKHARTKARMRDHEIWLRELESEKTLGKNKIVAEIIDDEIISLKNKINGLRSEISNCFDNVWHHMSWLTWKSSRIRQEHAMRREPHVGSLYSTE
jgi:hypothetical protein